MTASRYRSRRIATAFAAVLLYAAVAVVLPVAHAETEVLQGATGIERGHSDACPRIHSDSVCVLVGAFQLPTNGTPVPRSAAAEVGTKVRAAANPTPRHPGLTTRFVRAPPVT
jgi:hypothetical protein